MIYTLDHWIIFGEKYKDKKILAYQNNHSTCFALCQKMPSLKFDKYWKSSSSGLGKMPSISYLRERESCYEGTTMQVDDWFASPLTQIL